MFIAIPSCRIDEVLVSGADRLVETPATL